jgi:toxin YhaV
MSASGRSLPFSSSSALISPKTRAVATSRGSNVTAGYLLAPAPKLLAAVRDATLRDIPGDPGADRYRQGNTLGPGYRHWPRDKFFQRFRLFFRYSSDPALIAYVWLNDDSTLRKSGGRTDAYAVFRAMLERGRPPTDWDDLVRECRTWTDRKTG